MITTYGARAYTAEAPFRFLSLSHTDLDGYSCTILAKIVEQAVPNTKGEYMNLSPNRLASTLISLKDELEQYDQIWVTDMAVSQEIVDTIISLGINHKIRIFDHHMTTVNPLPDWAYVAKYAFQDIMNPDVDHDNIPSEEDLHNEKLTCATMIFHNYLVYGPFGDYIKEYFGLNEVVALRKMKYYAQSVEAYDTFAFWPIQLKGELESFVETTGNHYLIDGPRLNALYHCVSHELFGEYIFDYFDHMKSPLNSLTHGEDLYSWVGIVIDLELSHNAQYVEQALKRLTYVPFKKKIFKDNKVLEFNYLCGIVFAEKNGPTIGNTACNKFPAIDFCAVVANNQVSLYSIKDEVKVCDIAAALGGGGHDGAAGFTISYQSANIFAINHFFNIVDCAGRIVEPVV